MQTGKHKTTVRDYFRVLRIIHLALLSGQILFGVLAFVLVNLGVLNLRDSDFGLLLLLIVSVFSILGFLSGNMLFRKRLSHIQPNASLVEKLVTYRNVLITRYALLEGPGFLSIVAYLLTSDIVFLLITGLLILVFISLLPSASKAISDLDLHLSEQVQINNPETELQIS